MANMNDRNDLGTSSGSGGLGDWSTEENYWRTNYNTRPYASADRSFDHYRPGYQYGYESAQRFRGRNWNEVEQDLSSGWDSYEHRGDNRSTWEQIKHSVKDAWDRVTGHGDRDDLSRGMGDSSSRTTY